MIETLGHIFKHILIKVFPEKCSDHQCVEDSAEHSVKLSSDFLAAAHSVKHDQ